MTSLTGLLRIRIVAPELHVDRFSGQCGWDYGVGWRLAGRKMPNIEMENGNGLYMRYLVFTMDGTWVGMLCYKGNKVGTDCSNRPRL